MVTVLYGIKHLEPVKYTLRRLARGKGILESEFMTLEGEFVDLLAYAPMLGRIKIVD